MTKLNSHFRLAETVLVVSDLLSKKADIPPKVAAAPAWDTNIQ